MRINITIKTTEKFRERVAQGVKAVAPVWLRQAKENIEGQQGDAEPFTPLRFVRKDGTSDNILHPSGTVLLPSLSADASEEHAFIRTSFEPTHWLHWGTVGAGGRYPDRINDRPFRVFNDEVIDLPVASVVPRKFAIPDDAQKQELLETFKGAF